LTSFQKLSSKILCNRACVHVARIAFFVSYLLNAVEQHLHARDSVLAFIESSMVMPHFCP